MKSPFDKHYQSLFAKWQKGYKSALAKTSLAKAPKGLIQALRYSLDAGGKRLRPVLVLESARLEKLSAEKSILIATAFECLHTYSLVHDDLPALDNDDLRRGKPTSHKKFGEDVAILVGDGLQSVGLELANLANLPMPAMAYFLEAIGPAGMVGGQYLDIKSSGQNNAYLKKMHQLKTGKLIEAAIMLPFLVKNKISTKLNQRRLKWATLLGQLFQIVDDILDETSSADKLGKSVGKDRKSGKLTYVSVYGLETARKKANSLSQKLNEEADYLFAHSTFYQHIANYILMRQL